MLVPNINKSNKNAKEHNIDELNVLINDACSRTDVICVKEFSASKRAVSLLKKHTLPITIPDTKSAKNNINSLLVIIVLTADEFLKYKT